MFALNWVGLIVWTAIGFVIYLTYGVKNSVMRKAQRQK